MSLFQAWAYEKNKYKKLLGREKNINNSAEIFLDTIKKQIKLQLNSYLLENLNQYSTEIDAKARLYWTGYLATWGAAASMRPSVIQDL